MYNHGLVVSRDLHEAMMWYAKAAAMGDARAMNNIGILLTDGDPIPPDLPKALEW